MLETSMVAEEIVLIALVAVLSIYLWTYVHHAIRFVYLASRIRGPSFWSLLTTHAKDLMSEDHLHILCRLAESFGHKPWGMPTVGDFYIFVNDCETMSEVYKNKKLLDKAHRYFDILNHYVGRGLLSLDGLEYKSHRKLEHPAFRKRFVDSRFHRTVVQTSELVDRLRELPTEQDADLRYLIDDFGYALSFSSFASDDISHIDRRPMLETATAVNEIIDVRMKNNLYYHFVHKFKTKTKITEERIKANKMSYKNFFLEQRQLAMNRMRDSNVEPSNISECIARRVTETVGMDFTDEEYFQGAMLILVAGSETTSVVVNVTLLLLALHQEIQQRVFQEIESIFGKSDRPIEIQDTDKMGYLEMVIKESLRLFPPAPMILKKFSEETKLTSVVVPKGATVVAFIMALHRDPSIFKDPLKFDPDRFLPQEAAGRHPFAYLPFSYGSRDCPGQYQAFTTVKTTLSLILRNFRLLPGDRLRSMDDIKVTSATTTRLQHSSLRLVNRHDNVE